VNTDQVLEEVAAAVGQSDFGHPSFRVALDQLADAIEGEAQLNPMGQAVFAQQTRTALATRLAVTDWHRRNPSLARTAIERPIFIIGASRTGTTALSHLLSVDPANRSLLGWEANDPLPPPTSATYATDARFVRAVDADKAALFNPGFKAIHHDPPDAPVECLVVFNQHFSSLALSAMYVIPSYDRWLLHNDMQPAFAYHRSVLQILQSECPGGWQLKSPQHSLFLDDLIATYPDAKFVQIHRDPVKAIASTCSLVRALSGPFSDADHARAIAAHWSEMLVRMIDRVIEFRERRPDVVVHDMPYTQLTADPVGAVRDLYRTFGRELSADAAARMRAYSEREAQHKYGVHSYSLADSGLERGLLDERFARYYEAHEVVRERA
jgi:hypothetical protein